MRVAEAEAEAEAGSGSGSDGGTSQNGDGLARGTGVGGGLGTVGMIVNGLGTGANLRGPPEGAQRQASRVTFLDMAGLVAPP